MSKNDSKGEVDGFFLISPHLFCLSAPPPLVFQLLSRWRLQSLHISAFIKKIPALHCLYKISAILIKPLKVQLWKAFEQSKCDGSSCKKVWQDLHIDFALTEIWEKEIDGRVMLFMVTGAGNMLLCY